VLHKRGEALLKKSIEEARRAGCLQGRKIRVRWTPPRSWARER
jgi:hypothetical protein